MRKLKLLLLLPLLLLSACEETHGENGGVLYFGGQYEHICSHMNLKYLRDRETDIVYMYYDTSYHTGLSAYYNTEGMPMTYTEFQQVHTAKYHN